MIGLGIDQAVRSGWAIARGRNVLAFGLATTHAHRRAAVELAIELADGDPRQVIAMLEDHTGMALGRLTRDDKTSTRANGRPGAPERSTASIIGQGKAYGRWLEVLDMLAHPQTLRDDVKPHVWRGAVGVRGKGTDMLKAEAIKVASGFAGALITDDNVAEAVCIAVFAGVDGVARNDKRLREARADRKGGKQAASQSSLDEYLSRLNTLTPEDVIREMRGRT